MKGSLYLKMDSEGRAAFEAFGALPFQYSSRSETVTVTSYYEVPAQIIDDPDTLALWADRAYAAALKPKRGPKSKRYREKNTVAPDEIGNDQTLIQAPLRLEDWTQASTNTMPFMPSSIVG